MATRNEQIGRIGEKLVEIELIKRNINFWSMGENNPYFDLIVDIKGHLKKVQIKTARPNYKNKFQFYLKNCFGEYNYLILVVIKSEEKRDFYIIPEEKLEPQTGIKITKNTQKRYSQFKENWSVFL